ncbi:site-specific integrase [uncultured Roseibium sp.]|uniref:site-specific integrase n=1 Tax=uncultured Roseibium sp. TaxID=1936171 RepID=UPI002620211F|nr:site-specific integrase [uncultured Roseibium sp.]
MPRPRKAPRLWFRKERSGTGQWLILDGSKQVRTGCAYEDTAGAEQQLQAYLAQKYQPTNSLDPRTIPVADALNFYATHHIPTLANPKNEGYILKALVPFWGELFLSDVARSNSKRYATERFATGVKPGTVRRELKALQSAINMYVEDREVPFVCRMEFPRAGESRLRWLTRSEAAAFVHAARRRGNHHIARIILIGIYTGTRIDAIKRMQWYPNPASGYFDLDEGVMYRKGWEETSTTKRRPSVHISDRLLPHLKRWKRLDANLPWVIHYEGESVTSVKRAWRNSRADAQLGAEVVPHTLRHTAASWGIQNVESTQELQALADFLGMSLKMLLEVYGHLNPAHQKSAAAAIGRRPTQNLGIFSKS